MTVPSWLDRVEFPFTSRSFSLPAGRMHYIDEGQGRPLVMVHGTPEWSFAYRHLVKVLSPSYRCIAMDHLGFGLSDKPVGWSYLPQDHAANLAALIDSLNLDGITLVVHDFGGPIGLSYAIDHPERVRNLVVMNTWMWPLDDDPHFTGSKLFHGALGRFLYEHLAFSARVMLPSAMGDKSKLTRSVHRHYLKPWRTAAERHGTWVLAREVIGSSAWYASLWQRRERIRDLPALILWGMKDFAFRQRELERMAAVFRTPQVKAYESYGHFLTEELGPDLAAEIALFLASTP